MAHFFGQQLEPSDFKLSSYSDNHSDVVITTEGVLEGLEVVMKAFEENGLIEELKKSCIPLHKEK